MKPGLTFNHILLFTACLLCSAANGWTNTPIDRRALVNRHHINFDAPNPADIHQVGNGEVAFGIDVTGLQTLYGNAFAQWGWHTSPLPKGITPEDFKMTEVEVHGHTATYPVEMDGQE